MNLYDEMIKMGDRAGEAARALSTLNTIQKNHILQAMAEGLDSHRESPGVGAHAEHAG